jgi:hypothetical protein
MLAAILLYFYTERSIFGVQKENTDPKPYVERCVRKYVDEAINTILPQGGFVNPKNFKLNDGIKREYLCRHTGYYRPCINQHPMYLNDVKKEIENYTKPKIEQCFNDLRDELSKMKESMTLGPLSLNVELMPSRVRVDIQRNITIVSGGEEVSISNFNAEITSPLYELVNVAMEIANQEARYCYFDNAAYGLMHPKVRITKEVMSDATKIYSVQDKETFKELTFAIRGCGLPPGYG